MNCFKYSLAVLALLHVTTRSVTSPNAEIMMEKYACQTRRKKLKYLNVLQEYIALNSMTTGGRVLIVVEELLFAYATYVVLFDIYWKWWEYFTPDEYRAHLKEIIFVGVSKVLVLK